MTEIQSQYPYATVEETYDEFTGRPMFAAYCDSDCAEEIDFIPYDGSPEQGAVTIWFVRDWAVRNIGDGSAEYQQFGYQWENVSKEDFARIIGDVNSIGATANYTLIQPRANDSSLLTRSYRR